MDTKASAFLSLCKFNVANSLIQNAKLFRKDNFSCRTWYRRLTPRVWHKPLSGELKIIKIYTFTYASVIFSLFRALSTMDIHLHVKVKEGSTSYQRHSRFSSQFQLRSARHDHCFLCLISNNCFIIESEKKYSKYLLFSQET